MRTTTFLMLRAILDHRQNLPESHDRKSEKSGWLQTLGPAKDRLCPSKKRDGCKFTGQRGIVCVLQRNGMVANLVASEGSFVPFKETGRL